MSLQFKNKVQTIQQNQINENRSYITTAKVLQSHEKNNACDIEYVDNKGQICQRKGILLKISDPKMLGYFPHKGDVVYLECYKSTLLITGPYYKDENFARGGTYKTENNILYSRDYGIFEGNIL